MLSMVFKLINIHKFSIDAKVQKIPIYSILHLDFYLNNLLVKINKISHNVTLKLLPIFLSTKIKILFGHKKDVFLGFGSIIRGVCKLSIPKVSFTSPFIKTSSFHMVYLKTAILSTFTTTTQKNSSNNVQQTNKSFPS